MTTNTDSIDINFLATLRGPGRHAKQIMTVLNEGRKGAGKLTFII